MVSDSLIPAKTLLALCVAVGILVVGYVYLFKSRQVDKKKRDNLRRRALEKETDSRALEDSLLQNTQGLILRFHAVTDRMAANDPARRPLEHALLRAEQVLAEETERVLALSQPDHDRSDLIRLFAIVGKEIIGSRKLTFLSATEGIPRALHTRARSEIYVFGREALLNAVHHSHAHQIEVQVVYTDDSLLLRIRDDGLGVEAEQIERSARSQRSGLKRMQNCAATLGSKMEVWSRAGAGTEVGLVIPADIAYQDAARPNEQ